MPKFAPEKIYETPAIPQIQPAEVSPVVPRIDRDVVHAPEQVITPEHQQENQPTLAEQQLSAAEVPTPGGRSTAPTPTIQVPAAKTQERQEIEKVLSANVMEVYQMLTPAEQEQFRKAGEEAASKIEVLVTQFKATARTVLEIIRAWLGLIPRVNVYFLEQESKIKTDQILKYQRKLKVQNHKTHL